MLCLRQAPAVGRGARRPPTSLLGRGGSAHPLTDGFLGPGVDLGA